MKLPEIVGIAGTNASGKDTLGHVRARLANAKMVSLSDILRRELDQRGLSHERENLRQVGDEWRTAEGPQVLAVRTIDLYNSEKDEAGYKGLTVTSIRNAEEARAIQQAGGKIIWVDADRRLRYERIRSRNLDRPEDQKTYEQFVAEEEAELNPTEGNTLLNMGAVRDIADITIINEFPSLEEYEAYLEKEFELG
jgi:dephospho-CoA kinase